MAFQRQRSTHLTIGAQKGKAVLQHSTINDYNGIVFVCIPGIGVTLPAGELADELGLQVDQGRIDLDVPRHHFDGRLHCLGPGLVAGHAVLSAEATDQGRFDFLRRSSSQTF